MKKILTFILSMPILVACTKTLAVSDYVAWCSNPDSGLISKKESGPFRFEMEYRPQELVALQNVNGNIADEVAFKEELEALSGFQFFNFKIAGEGNADFLRTGIGDQNEYYQRIAYFSSFAQSDFSLVDGKDTLSCSMYHFERNYGISPYQTILLGFENNKASSGDKTLIYEDQILGIPSIQMEISAKAIKQIPNLKL
ncbi:MAG: hypothetical protein ACPF9D_03465 [Owenweeksia sp.]